jgi:cyclopropane-fatty-acyl-phospholipid synthase
MRATTRRWGAAMLHALAKRFLSGLIRQGHLVVHVPGGEVWRFGDTGEPPLTLRISDPAVIRKLLVNPEMAVGEAYMDGTLTIDGDDLDGLQRLAIRNITARDLPVLRHLQHGWRRLTRWIDQHNPIHRAHANVAHHYDLSGELYALFLDADRQYSCAYFRDPGVSLEQAQADKKAHIARKLALEPGMRVLDIGCGWGGMGLTLARDHGVQVVGVTLSREQQKVAAERARAVGLDDRVEFRLQDYRKLSESFDRIVSVGMFEHVGLPHYREYFDAVRDRLVPGGVALIHTIGRIDGPHSTNPWLAKYIFPGGYIPAVSEVIPAIEKSGLILTDLEVWRMHYADTIRHWADRFEAHIDRVRALYDDRFVRMWRFYLSGSAMSFRAGVQVVHQYQLTRRMGTLPLTRDYMYPANPDGRPAVAPPSERAFDKAGIEEHAETQREQDPAR